MFVFRNGWRSNNSKPTQPKKAFKEDQEVQEILANISANLASLTQTNTGH